MTAPVGYSLTRCKQWVTPGGRRTAPAAGVAIGYRSDSDTDPMRSGYRRQTDGRPSRDVQSIVVR